MLVLRPADAEETTIAWKLAMENMSTPTGLIFSRQNIANLPAGTDYEQAAKGAYIVAGSDENPDVILVASGSEVSTLVAGTELLRKDGVKVRIVSAPSEGLFRNQPKEYQEAILRLISSKHRPVARFNPKVCNTSVQCTSIAILAVHTNKIITIRTILYSTFYPFFTFNLGNCLCYMRPICRCLYNK